MKDKQEELERELFELFSKDDEDRCDQGYKRHSNGMMSGPISMPMGGMIMSTRMRMRKIREELEQLKTVSPRNAQTPDLEH